MALPQVVSRGKELHSLVFPWPAVNTPPGADQDILHLVCYMATFLVHTQLGAQQDFQGKATFKLGYQHPYTGVWDYSSPRERLCTCPFQTSWGSCWPISPAWQSLWKPAQPSGVSAIQTGNFGYRNHFRTWRENTKYLPRNLFTTTAAHQSALSFKLRKKWVDCFKYRYPNTLLLNELFIFKNSEIQPKFFLKFAGLKQQQNKSFNLFVCKQF